MKKLAIATMACGVLFTTACSNKTEEAPKVEQTVEEKTVSIEEIGTSIKEAVIKFFNDPEFQLVEGRVPGWDELDVQDELALGMYPMFADLDIEGTLYVPMMNVKSDLVAVVKAKDGNVDAVKTAFEQLKADQEATWSTYLPDQYEKVKANKIIVEGDYVLYVTFDDTSVVEEAFLNTIAGK